MDSVVFLILLLNNSKSEICHFTWNFQLENILHGSINLVKFSRSWRSKTSPNHHYKIFYLFRNSMLTFYPMQQYAHFPNRYGFVFSRVSWIIKMPLSKCEMRLCPPLWSTVPFALEFSHRWSLRIMITGRSHQFCPMLNFVRWSETKKKKEMYKKTFWSRQRYVFCTFFYFVAKMKKQRQRERSKSKWSVISNFKTSPWIYLDMKVIWKKPSYISDIWQQVANTSQCTDCQVLINSESESGNGPWIIITSYFRHRLWPVTCEEGTAKLTKNFNRIQRENKIHKGYRKKTFACEGAWIVCKRQ